MRWFVNGIQWFVHAIVRFVHAMKVGLDHGLVEAVVREAEAAGLLECATFHRAREKAYTISDGDERDAAHEAFYRRWFTELGLDAPIIRVLGEFPELNDAIAHCTLSASLRGRDEGAELYVGPEEPEVSARDRRRLSIRFLPRTLLDERAASFLLRRELTVVSDMVDPTFGYEPRLPPSPAGPTHDRLLLERYSALWSTSVLGRLAARGHLPSDAPSSALSHFVRVFPAPRDHAEAIFTRFFSGQRPTHGALVAFCLGWQLGHQRQESSGARCALCGFPTYAPERATAFSAKLKSVIAADFPRWDPREGVCRQCADLYRARADAAVA